MPKSETELRARPIRLHFTDVQTSVIVTPEDEDRFITTAAEAARACQHAQDALQWKHEFDQLLTQLYEWCRAHASDVSHAYMAFSPEGLHLFILTRGPGYRFDFDDAVSDLDIKLAERFPRCPTEFLQLPEVPIESLTSFFDPGKALQLYGE
jgi:hypothetical protein